MKFVVKRGTSKTSFFSAPKQQQSTIHCLKGCACPRFATVRAHMIKKQEKQRTVEVVNFIVLQMFQMFQFPHLSTWGWVTLASILAFNKLKNYFLASFLLFDVKERKVPPRQPPSLLFQLSHCPVETMTITLDSSIDAHSVATSNIYLECTFL